MPTANCKLSTLPFYFPLTILPVESISRPASPYKRVHMGYKILLLCFCPGRHGIPQFGEVGGVVTDTITGEPLGFANISLDKATRSSPRAFQMKMVNTCSAI